MYARKLIRRGFVVSTTHTIHLDLTGPANQTRCIPNGATPLLRMPPPRPAREDLELTIWKTVDLLAQPQVMCCDREPQADKYAFKSAVCTRSSQDRSGYCQTFQYCFFKDNFKRLLNNIAVDILSQNNGAPLRLTAVP